MGKSFFGIIVSLLLGSLPASVLSCNYHSVDKEKEAEICMRQVKEIVTELYQYLQATPKEDQNQLWFILQKDKLSTWFILVSDRIGSDCINLMSPSTLHSGTLWIRGVTANKASTAGRQPLVAATCIGLLPSYRGSKSYISVFV